MGNKLVYGVGVNDAEYVTQKFENFGYVGGKRKQKRIWVCHFYGVWVDMLRRCYSEKFQEKCPTYRGCSVCEGWWLFSNFKDWVEAQDFEGKQLDKDILFPGNKVYSPETCVFTSFIVNTFVIERGKARGEWPIGVSWVKHVQKFQAECNNPFTKKKEYLGLFACQEKAHEAWLTRKLELAKLLAAEQDDPRVAKALIEKYENYKDLV